MEKWSIESLAAIHSGLSVATTLAANDAPVSFDVPTGWPVHESIDGSEAQFDRIKYDADDYTREEARRAILRCIKTWYNLKRRHSTLGDVSPARFIASILTRKQPT
jgi:hypothetical protein